MGKIQITNFDGVYEPAEDSWLMARHIPQFQGSVLEIGCGSGIISMHLAQRGNVVTAIDINPKAVEATKFNSKENDLEIEVLEGSEKIINQYSPDILIELNERSANKCFSFLKKILSIHQL